MLALIAAAAVVIAAIMISVAHGVAAAVFARPSPLATVVTALGVLAAGPAAYLALSASGRDGGVLLSTRAGFVLSMSAVTVVAAAYLLVMVPRALRRDTQADARVGLWHAAVEDRPSLRIAVVRSYDMSDGASGWAELQIGPHAWTVWLNGRCRKGEIILIESMPDVPSARIIDRLTLRETARYQQRHTRSDLTTAA